MKIEDVSETIAACDLRVGRCRRLMELMTVYRYLRLRSFLDLGPRSFLYMLFSSPEPKAQR